MNLHYCAWIWVAWVLALAPAGLAQDVRQISPTDSAMRYVGRWSISDKSARASWSGSMIELRIEGPAKVAIHASTSRADRLQIEFDGLPTRVIQLTRTPSRHVVADDLKAGSHLVRIVKINEPLWGVVTISSIEIADGIVLKQVPDDSIKQIKIVGDSISAGYGNEAASEKLKFSADTQNATKTYGALAAKAFDADVQIVAWSGRRMWPTFTIPEIYPRTLPDVDASQYDFAGWSPDVVVIALGTNDFLKGGPDEVSWVNVYASFIESLRRRYCKQTIIYVASSPMMSDTWPTKKSKSCLRLKRYLEKVIGRRAGARNRNVRFIEFA